MLSVPRWALAARIAPALACLSALGQIDGVTRRVALASLAAVYAGWAIALDRLAPQLRDRLPRGAIVGADLAVVAVGGWLTSRAGWPAAAAVSALPVIALHSWEAGRQWGMGLAGAATLVASVGAAASVGRQPLHGVEVVAFGLVAAWTVGSTVRLNIAEAQADARAEDLAAARRLLVRNVSHELRTPLTVIQGLLTTLFQRWGTMSEPQRLDLIDAASVNVSSLDASILHFIDAGEVERDEMTVSVEHVDLDAAVEQVRHKLSVALTGYDLQPHLEVSSLWSDPAAVARILELFIENAARFSPVGSPVVVGARRHGDHVELSVMDRGRGISPAEREHVFEPFWRADVQETGVSRGAGLGLYIAKELAERLGGQVGFQSVKGRGTKFFALLPDADPLAAPLAPTRARPRRTGSRAARRS